MAKQFASMTRAHRDFIARQRIFFTASATSASQINVSPRPTDVLRRIATGFFEEESAPGDRAVTTKF
jgi:hypothetical protein